MSEINFNYLLKYIIIGDSAVGKSNILTRYVYEKFNEEFQSTLGVEFAAKNAIIDNKIYRIQIWDSSDINSIDYFSKISHGCLIFSEATNINTRNEAIKIKETIDKNSGCYGETIPCILIENKKDLLKEDAINAENDLKSRHTVLE